MPSHSHVRTVHGAPIHQSSLRRAFFIFAMNILEKRELATEAIKAAPPLAVVGTSLAGAVSWSDIAYAMAAPWMSVALRF